MVSVYVRLNAWDFCPCIIIIINDCFVSCNSYMTKAITRVLFGSPGKNFHPVTSNIWTYA
jgi:hypothetical protein